MASPVYPPMINIVPRSGAPVPSPPVSNSRSRSIELDMQMDEEPALSPSPSMFDQLANESKTRPVRHAPSPQEPEPEPQEFVPPRSRRPRARSHVSLVRARANRRARRRTVMSRSRSRSRMQPRMRSRSRSRLSGQNRFGNMESDNGSLTHVEEPAPHTPIPVSTETRAQKLVRIEANLVAMRMDVHNLETLTEAELDALDEKLKAQSSRENILKLMRRAVTLFSTLVEHAHTQFNPKSKHLLKGWSQEVYHGVLKCEYDHHLLAIYDYYSPRAALHPVLGFVLALGGSACMYAITRHFMETGLESMREFVSAPDFATNVRQTFQDSKTNQDAPTELNHAGAPDPNPQGQGQGRDPGSAPTVPAAQGVRIDPALVASSAVNNPMMDMIGSVLRNPGGMAPMIDAMVGMMGQQSQLQPQLAPVIGSARASMAPFAQPQSLAAGPPQMPVLGTMSPPPPPRQMPAPIQSSDDVLNQLRNEERAHFAQSQPEGQPEDESPDVQPSGSVNEANDANGVLNIMLD